MPEHPFDRYSAQRLDSIRAELRHYRDVARHRLDAAGDDLRETALQAVQDAESALERIEIYLRKDKTNG